MVIICSKSTRGANKIEILTRERIAKTGIGKELTCDATSLGKSHKKINLGCLVSFRRLSDVDFDPGLYRRLGLTTIGR